jgi:uncharacterized repeat protein (TIGR03847 family)
MAGRTFFFDPPDRFVAGAVGQPGQRTFFLQATKGSAVLSVACEKVQVALLATRLGELIDTLERSAAEGHRAAQGQRAARARAQVRAVVGLGEQPRPARGLTEPVVEAFRIGSMTITYDDERHDLTLEARELGDDGDDPDEGQNGESGEGGGLVDVGGLRAAGHVMRVRLGLEEARSFAEDAMAVLAAGRLPCPICGEPLDPQGHICLRRNGYVM